MKINFFLALVAAVLLVSCGQEKDADRTISSDVINVPATASGKAVPGSTAVMTFEDEEHDFGKITQGEIVTYAFMFTNTGGSDLVISSAQGSCGCTIPNYPKEAIKPGQKAKVDVKFESAGKAGLVKKTVTLITNCSPSTKVITIIATVNVPEED